MRAVRWVVLGALATAGCQREAKPAPPAPSSPSPIEAVELESTAPLPGSACPLPPSWMFLRPCAEGGYAYARAETPEGLNPSLALREVSYRARWALAEALGWVQEGRATLEGTEVPDLFVCEGTAHALARVETEAHHLPGCGTTLRSRAIAPEGCPEWARGRGWREEETIVGTAVSDNVDDPGLARSSVLRRARGAAAEVVRISLSERGGQIRGFTKTTGLTLVASDVARCDGRTWGRVRVERPNLKGR